MQRRIINPWAWQDKLGFVQANEVSGETRTLHCAGQVSVAPDGSVIHAGDMAGQIRQCFSNLETVLAEAGIDLSHVVRLSYYITDMKAFREAGPIMGEILAKGSCRPATAVV